MIIKVHRFVYLPQQVLLWHQAVYPNDLYYIPIHFPAFQHCSHHLLLFYHL